MEQQKPKIVSAPPLAGWMSKKNLIVAILVLAALLLIGFAIQNQQKASLSGPAALEESGEAQLPQTAGETSAQTTATGGTAPAGGGPAAVARAVYAPDGSHLIYYSSAGFSPSVVSVKAGGSVTFVDESSGSLRLMSNPHPAHTDYPAFNQSQSIGPAGRLSVGNLKAGTWGFHNEFNPDYLGLILVSP